MTESRTLHIWNLPDDQHQRLVEIAVEHTSLAAEFGDRKTTDARKAEIWRRIEELRRERSAILEE
ncbi:hypothetical protein [Effusibacillus pohliae]|uniref:hypothetical protein n=1 Tax=Effusibacillus pohliae TaxID=232270 RepID=UPI0003631D2D|nr:hypothetical protein [Effusibacillus pohliae]